MTPSPLRYGHHTWKPPAWREWSGGAPLIIATNRRSTRWDEPITSFSGSRSHPRSGGIETTAVNLWKRIVGRPAHPSVWKAATWLACSTGLTVRSRKTFCWQWFQSCTPAADNWPPAYFQSSPVLLVTCVQYDKYFVDISLWYNWCQQNTFLSLMVSPVFMLCRGSTVPPYNDLPNTLNL